MPPASIFIFLKPLEKKAVLRGALATPAAKTFVICYDIELKTLTPVEQLFSKYDRVWIHSEMFLV